MAAMTRRLTSAGWSSGESDNGREYRTILSIVSENVVQAQRGHDRLSPRAGLWTSSLRLPLTTSQGASHNNAVNYGGHHLIPPWSIQLTRTTTHKGT